MEAEKGTYLSGGLQNIWDDPKDCIKSEADMEAVNRNDDAKNCMLQKDAPEKSMIFLRSQVQAYIEKISKVTKTN